MSGEIVVPETPNWLQELEDKRERRLKARLGHEAGAGAPCLKCGDNCPGLDLHFWRKSCKICKCAKEEHEVQDDDIYGWAQFQLLGSKPNKIKKKILLPGKKDEIDLEWVPKGHNETIDKYLKTLPPEQLPIKGSQAAQDRKQLLQKQIPIHDIDPTLCHELTEEELKKMNEYIVHVKQSSAGVGQIVSLSSIIKGKLHMLNPAEAAILANRYAKGVPISEIVKLQAQSRSGALSQNLEKMSLKNKNLPNFNPNTVNQTEDISNPINSMKMHDKDYPLYSSDVNRPASNAQFSIGLGPKQFKSNVPNAATAAGVDPSIDPKYLPNPNFDPKNRPSNFINPTSPYNPALPRDNMPFGKNPLEYNSENSAFVPYQKISSVPKPGDTYLEDNSSVNPNYAKSFSGPNRNQNSNKNPLSINSPNYQGIDDNGQIYENLQDLKKSPANLPNYAPGKYNMYADTQSPTRIPKNVKDLAFSTYEVKPSDFKEIQEQENGFKFGKYRKPGSYSDEIPKNSNGFRPIEAGNHGNPNIPSSQQGSQNNQVQPLNPHVTNVYPGSSVGSKSGDIDNHNGSINPNLPTAYPGNSVGLTSEDINAHNAQFETLSPHSYLSNSTGVKSGHVGGQSSQMNPNNAPSNSYSGLTAEDVAAHNAQFDPTSPNMYNPGPKSGDFRGHNAQYNQSSYPGLTASDVAAHNAQFDPTNPNVYSNNLASQKSGDPRGHNMKFDPFMSNTGNATGLRSGDVAGHKYGSIPEQTFMENPNIDSTKNYQQPSDIPSHLGRGSDVPFSANSPLKSGKKLSELHPSDLRVNEDFLNPSQVNIGLIQDINYPDIKTATHEIGDFYEEYSPDSIKEILNNVILPDCHYCKKPFEENEFAVSIDRANVLFHAECFKCAGCNQILADNVYFYNKETDNIYCLRDYAKIRGFPRCKACDELIFTKEYCLAENSTFHLKHFCCTACDMPLAGQDYLLEDEMPYCLPCFEQNKASKCNTCGKVIKPDEVGCNLKGVHFHAVDACFACKVCKTPLMGKKLLLRNDKLYCSHECYGSDQ